MFKLDTFKRTFAFILIMMVAISPVAANEPQEQRTQVEQNTTLQPLKTLQDLFNKLFSSWQHEPPKEEASSNYSAKIAPPSFGVTSEEDEDHDPEG